MQLLSEIHERVLFEEDTGISQQLYWALELAAADFRHKHTLLAVAHRQFRTAISHRRMRFFFNAREEAVAFVAWADLAADVHSRWLSGDITSLHESEWNEGKHRWFHSFAAPYGHSRRVISMLLREQLANPCTLPVHLLIGTRFTGYKIKQINFQTAASPGRGN
jgi:cytolysin-activating lysine-acyltransferase